MTCSVCGLTQALYVYMFHFRRQVPCRTLHGKSCPFAMRADTVAARLPGTFGALTAHGLSFNFIPPSLSTHKTHVT